MTGPLSVRLADGVRDAHVSKRCRSLSFTKAAPGGHTVAQMRLDVPLADWPDLGDADRVWLYDVRTGATVWEGYTNEPGADRETFAGEGFDLTAQGGASLASDDRRMSVFIDYSQESNILVRSDQLTPSATIQLAANDANSPTYGKGVLFQFVPGAPITTGSQVSVDYTELFKTGQRLYSVAATVVCGKTDANYTQEIYVRVGAGAWNSAASRTFNTVAAGMTPVVVTNFALGSDAAHVIIWRSAGGATTVGDDTTWGGYYGLHFRPILLNLDGTDDLTVASLNYVLASEVVADLVARMLPLVDAAASTVATTTAQIDQLAYRQAVTARTTFDDLTLWEPGYLWEILHTTGTGKHIFNYRAWPTTPRYEISLEDGYTKTGTDSGLCNRLAVSWNDFAGIPQSLTVSAVVPELIIGGVTRIRHADPINLPDGRGSAAAAAAIGAAVLADINTRSKAASATVRRPIVDLQAGGLAQPWEILPGYLARIRETGDLLPISEMTYNWSDDAGGATTLALGRPRLTVEQRVARLDRVAFAT